jgi:methionyl-tRNA synthetase
MSELIDSNKFYVTTPIYYVNDVPHIGHAYTTIAADILTRYNRLKGKKTFFLTGTDEHGQKVEKAAGEKGKTPKEHADLMVENFKALWEHLNISHDAFIRTTDPEHIKTVQGIIQMLYDRGEIEKRQYSGWYCTPDERFWTEKEIVEGNCPDCGRPVEEIQEENYFFLMSKYHDRLIKHIEDNPDYILPETRKNEVLGFLKHNELGDLCITRPTSRLSWGVPIPFDENFVTYVWFDALLNYFSATRYLAPDAGRAGQGDFWWPASHHIVGKDILTTHAVYWSTMLMALNFPLPDNIFAHGWWTVEGKKMSKSLGNVFDPAEMAEKYGIDAFRYFIFREVPFGLDGDFSEEAMARRINTDLANDIGNLLSRSLKMIEKYRDGAVPSPAEDKDRDELENKIKKWFDNEDEDGLLRTCDTNLSKLHFHQTLTHIWKAISEINEYIASSEPWKENDQDVLSNILYTLAESIRLLAVYIYPFMPDTANKVWQHLGLNEDIGSCTLNNIGSWGGLKPGTKVQKGEALFPRIDIKKLFSKQEKTAAKDKQNNQAKPQKDNKVEEPQKDNLISINDFARVQLKIGKVLEAEKVEGSDKLLRIQVDTGENRQIVAGIGKSYSPDELTGKSVVVVTNLKPAKLMGIESNGMLLAATDSEGVLSILTPEKDVKQGALIR